MGDRPPTEPTAEMRTAASAVWQMYVALRSEGFSEQQALTVVGHILAASQ